MLFERMTGEKKKTKEIERNELEKRVQRKGGKS